MLPGDCGLSNFGIMSGVFRPHAQNAIEMVPVITGPRCSDEGGIAKESVQPAKAASLR
jgi:hypothetical protein